MLKPKLFTTLKGYTKETFLADLSAGVIVGIVALPLAIAFAIASGVSPDKGLITAVIAGFLISVLGGSRVQIGGPTGAFVVIVYGIVQQYGFNGLMVATVMAGIILVIMGLARFGGVIKFIPFPVVVGFTSGIAIIIFSAQMKDFFGLQTGDLPPDFFEKWYYIIKNIHSFNINAFIIGAGSLLIMIFWNKLKLKIPGSIIVLLLATIIAYFLKLPVETIGSKFGAIASSIPMPVMPDISFALIKQMIQPAITLALLAAIESLLSAVVADGMIGGKHRSNMELVAQGVANIVTPFFGGIPATGAIARTVTNIKNGGRTPVAGIIHAITLLLIMLFLGSYAKLIPLSVLAAILIIVSYNMFEWRAFVSMFKNPRSDLIVMLITFSLTVVFDLTVAIEFGMILAVLLFMYRMSLVTNVGVVTREMSDTEEVFDEQSIDRKNIPDGVNVYEINGPFFFGAASKFKDTVERYGKKPKVTIIRMRNVPAIDATGIRFLDDIRNESEKKGIELLFAGLHAQPYRALEQSGFIQKINPENLCDTIDSALERANQIIDNTQT
jgi:SulP family sulfate permease